MAQTIISSWKQSFLGDPSTIFYGKDQGTGKLQIWVKKTLPMVGCSVQPGTLLLLGCIMSWHTWRIHILLDAAVRCMLLHMRLLGVNYVLNDPCCFSSVMSSLTCFSESVEVHPLAPSHAGEPSGFTVWLIMSNGAAGAACLPPLQGGNFLICQYWLDFCNARQLGGLFCRCFILACCMLSDSLVSHML